MSTIKSIIIGTAMLAFSFLALALVPQAWADPLTDYHCNNNPAYVHAHQTECAGANHIGGGNYSWSPPVADDPCPEHHGV